MGIPIVGIDLGTTNSVVAAVNERGDPAVLADETGRTVHPSIVSFHPNGAVLCGADARPRRIIDPHNTVYSAKRLIGRTFGSREVSSSRQRLPYRIIEGQNEQPMVVTRAGEFAIPEVSALLLDYLRGLASRRLGMPIESAVITVPANFTEAQRSATATAGAIAGVTVLRVLNEPSAAAMAYGHRKKLDETVAVYDFGGGTFDISILRVSKDTYEVLGTAGDSFLGGDDIDDRLLEHMSGLFLRDQLIDLHDNPVAIERLRVAVELTKVELGTKAKSRVNVQEIAYAAGGKPIHLSYDLTRDELNNMARPIIERTFPVCEEALRMAGLKREAVGSILLTGGTTRMPLLRSRVTAFFNKEARTDLSPDEAVALGAALQAYSLGATLPKAAPAPARPRAAAPAIPPRLPPAMPPRSASPPRAASAPPTRSSGVHTLPPLSQMIPPAQSKNPLAPEMDEEWTEPDARVPTHFSPAAIVAPPPAAIVAPPPAAIAAPPAAPALPLAKDLFDSGSSREFPLGASALSADEMTVTAPAAPATAWQTPRPELFSNKKTLHAAVPPPAARPRVEPAPSVPEPAPAPAPAPLVQMIDVTPHSLCLATVAGYCEPLIPRRSKVPTENSRVFSTSHDQQSMVRILVCQGESRRMDENQELGFLLLENLRPRPRGETRIEVTFRIDESGMVQVIALDQDTGQQQSVRLALRGAFSPEQIDLSRTRIQSLRSS